MPLNYQRTRKGFAYGMLAGSKLVVQVQGDGLPYSQTTSSLLSNVDLSSAALGSQYIDNTTGKLYLKQTDVNAVGDWIEAGTGSGGEASSLEDIR